MANLYLVGARQRKLLVRNEEEWNLYESALILQLDTETGVVRSCVEYSSPPEARAHEHSSNVFKAGTLVGDTLYTCTSTEVIIFRLPEFRRVGYVSLPSFNDLHHVTPTPEGNLLVASTGLDMVIEFTPEGKVLREWNVLDEPLWSRFSPEVDYRKVESTKPHHSHPNFVFQMDGETWATRFRQRDAICLCDPRKRIDIGVQSPHDGLVRDDRIYFTTVDGRIVIVNRHTLAVDQTIDLKEIDGQKALLGWCRGLLPVNDQKMWVGFTRVRNTLLVENVQWIKHVLRDGMSKKPTHITLYDIAEKRALCEFDLEQHGMNIIFGIFHAAPEEVDTQPALSASMARQQP